MKTFTHKTKKFSYLVQLTNKGSYLAQVTDYIPPSLLNKFEPRTHKIDNFKKVEDALNFIGWPVELAGIPKELV